MTSDQPSTSEPDLPATTSSRAVLLDRRWIRAITLLAGWVLPAIILYGPTLTGRKLLLPLYVLKTPRVYLPDAPPLQRGDDPMLSDPVLQYEPFRVYAAAEVRAGRLPLWNPYSYCGSPFVANNQSAVLSPFRLLDYAWPDPQSLAWGQLLRAIVHGTGAYLFFRLAINVSFWPAALGAWCWPLTGFMTLWALAPLSATAGWLPWLMLGVHASVTRPLGAGAIGLACATAAMLLSGHAATAGQALIGAGLYGVWLIGRTWWAEGRSIVIALRSALAPGLGFLAGVLLSAPQTFPTAEYLRTSTRLSARSATAAASQPQGLAAIPQLVLPYIYGSTQVGSTYWGWLNRPESAASGYAGAIAAMAIAPLALVARRSRCRAIFWIALGLIGLLPALGLPGVSRLFTRPPFDLFRNNRFVLLTCWSMLVLAVLGLDSLREMQLRSNRAWLLWTLVPATLAAWCCWRSGHFPAVLEERITAAASANEGGEIARWFHQVYAVSGAICAAAAALWVIQSVVMSRRLLISLVAGVFWVAELILAAWPVFPLCDRSLYYPPLPTLDALAASVGHDRALGVQCVPPNLNMVLQFYDVRGYDSADPTAIVELLELSRNPAFPPSHEYAVTQWFVPRVSSPLVNLLGIRFFYGPSPAPGNVRPILAGRDYWVAENRAALPRAFVPRRVQIVNDKAQRLRLLGAADFDPREVVYVEADTASLLGGATDSIATGQAAIVDEDASHVHLRTELSAAGVLLLCDAWDAGWHAYSGNRELPVLRADHALRAVPLPPGLSEVEFRYQPASFRRGCIAAGATAAALIAWCMFLRRRRGPRSFHSAPPQESVD